MIRRAHGCILAAAVIGVFGIENVAHTAPRARVEHPHFKPVGLMKLKTGEKVDAKRFADELNKLQEALESDGVSMKKSDHRPPPARIPFSKTALAEKAHDQAVIQQKAQMLRSIEAGGFKSLVQKRVGGRAPIGTHAASGVSRSMGDAQSMLPPGPMAMAYEETLGTKSRAAIYVGLNLRDTGDKESVGCDASIDGGVYLFDHKESLVKMTGSGKAKSGSLSGEIDVYVLGQSTAIFSKKGSAGSIPWSKSYNPPAVKTKIYWGPLSIDIEGSVAGEFRLNASNLQDGPPSAATTRHLGAATSPNGASASTGAVGDGMTTVGHCGLTMTPSVRASAKAKAMLDVVAFRAGLEGEIVLLDVKSPMSSSIALKKEPLTLKEDFKANLDAQFLDGKIDLVVESRIPDDWEVWDVDWKTVYKKNLFDWDGLKLDQKLADVSGKQEVL